MLTRFILTLSLAFSPALLFAQTDEIDEAVPVPAEDFAAPAETSTTTENAARYNGSIRGLVVADDAGAAFISGVSVTLLYPGAEAQMFGDEQPDTQSEVTDGRGEYRFDRVPAGIYKIQFFKEGYYSKVITQVEVLPQQISEINVPLAVQSESESTDVYTMESFEVTSQALGSQGVALEALRKQSPSSVDFLTSEEISKYGASDIAEAITRIPGINLVEGQFAVVRGLNDRYVNTLVNGVPVPSTDPTRQGVQLDLFPSGFVDNLIVEKTFLPYLPGNSGGGSINIITKDFPDEFEASFKIGMKLNTNAENNYIRFNVPGNNYLFGTAKGDFAGVPSAASSVSTANTYSPYANSQSSPPVGASFSGNFGDSFDVLDRKVGYYFGGSYNSSYKTIEGISQSRFGQFNPVATSPFSPNVPPGYSTRYPNGGPNFYPGSLSEGELPFTSGLFQLTQSTGDVLVGGLGTVGVDLDKDGLNTIRAVGFISQNGTTIAQRKANGYVPEGQGTKGDSLKNVGIIGANGSGTGDKFLNQDINYYRERQLISTQLIGSHTIEELDNLKVDWALNYAKASQDEPDQRIYNYFYNVNTGLYQNSNGVDFPNQLQRTWRSIDEEQRFARADVEYDFKFENDFNGKLQGGLFIENSERSTEQQDRYYDSSTLPITGSSPEELSNNFYWDRVAFNQGLGFAQPSGSENSRQVQSFYGMMTLPLAIEELKLTAGARLESTYMESQGEGLLGAVSSGGFWSQETSFNSGITNGDILGIPAGATGLEPGIIDQQQILPGVSLVYKPTDNVVLRGGWSKTIARPSFRELSPYFSSDFVTGDVLLGNPYLTISEVESWDLRAEYIWDNGDIFAVSVFYKDIENPIEKILLQEELSQATVTSYFNNPDRAVLKGFEVEVRKSLDFWSPELKNFTIGANFTMVDASVGVPSNVNSTYLLAEYPNFQNPSKPIPRGYYVDANGNVLSPPSERQLFDQPEYIVNADITYKNANMGTMLTLAVYAQSQVLEAAGTGGNVGVPDQYTDAYYQLDLIYSQRITQNLQFKLKLKNLTDTPRGVYYDRDIITPAVPRVSYKQGMDVSFEMEYTF